MDDETAEIAAAEFATEEKYVDEQSVGFKKELGLPDLVLTHILFIVGSPWASVPAEQAAVACGAVAGCDRFVLYPIRGGCHLSE